MYILFGSSSTSVSSSHLLRTSRLEASKGIVTESTVKVTVIFFSGRLASSIPIVTWSPFVGVIAVSIPTASSALLTATSLLTDHIHLILLVWEIVKAVQSHGADEGFHSHGANRVKKVVDHCTWPVAGIGGTD